MNDSAHRRLILLRGTPALTLEDALALIAGAGELEVLWVSDDAAARVLPERSEAPSTLEVVPPRGAQAQLGRGFDVVVIDAHHGVDPEVLGATQGMVRGGGALVLRRPTPGRRDEEGPVRERLAAHPHRAADVGHRFEARLERVLERAASTQPHLQPCAHVTAGTADQTSVVDALTRAWRQPDATRHALLADRGRGKSSALGLAMRQHVQDGAPPCVVTAGSEEAVREVMRFARGAARFVALDALLELETPPSLIAVDEAAQLPVPILQALAQRHQASHLVFSTTTHGYEGTGRGFSLRFLQWLEREHPPVTRLSMRAPIRWAAGDPLERAVFDALLLDAEPASELAPSSRSRPATDRLELVRLDRDALTQDESRLRELFGLLVHAHYRTTPGDLHRLLDAPNLEVHAALADGHVVAANVVAIEGDLPLGVCEDACAGRTRLRAHALPDALVAHLGRPSAGTLRLRRSVRIAVHPAWRRRHVATRLIEHTHAIAGPDLDAFGTMFGATAELVAFRRTLGYEVVRLSASRGTRTGEPSVMMLRPGSARAHDLVALVRDELAHELPTQLALLQADGELHLDPALEAALTEDLPCPAPRSPAQDMALVRTYAGGPRTFESVASAVQRFVRARPIDALPEAEARVLELRVLQGRGWRATARLADLPSIIAAMRALRRGVRSLLAGAGPPEPPE